MIKELTMAKQSLTSNWEYGTLGDAVNKGSSNISLNKVKEDDGEYQLYSAKGYNKNISFFHQEKEYLAIIKDGAGIGRVSKHPAKSSVVATMQYLIPKEGFDIGFVQYFLNGIDFESHRQGSTIPHVYFKDYKSEPFPLLPLTQQKQIVAILDKAFAAINTAKANAEQNLQNAKELFESYLQNVFENKGDDWEEKTLGEVVNFFNGFAFKSKDAIDDSNTQVIRMGNLYQNKLNLDRKPAFYPDAFKTEFSKYLLLEDDLIISLTGTTGKEDYGYTVKIPKTERNLLLNQRIAKFIIKDENVINRNYLFNFLLSRTFLDELYKTANGTRQANLSTETMKGLFISFPLIEKQKSIVQKLDALSKETKKLEANYTQKIADLEEMKKSVLQKAFSGQLNTLN
jgi:type I restriction enzyme S subunit